jgi:hypothetical protein
MIRKEALERAAPASTKVIGSRLGGRKMDLATYAQRRNRPVLLLGHGLFFFITMAMLLPLTIRNTQQFTMSYVILSALYALLAIGVSRSFVRPVFPIAILLGLQVWNLVTYLVVSPQVIMFPILGRHLYWPILLVLPYFVLGSIIMLDPGWREKAIRILFWFCMISALVGLAQFLRIPGFHAIQAFYSPTAIAEDFFGNTPNLYRAVGLTLHPYLLAAQCLFGMALIGSNLLYRKIKPWEILSFVIFLSALFVAQSRAYYVSGALTVIVLLVLLYKRDKPMFVASVTSMTLCAVFLMAVFGSRLEYGTKGQGLAESGRLERWAAVAGIVEEFPVTGVGPNTRLFGNDTLKLPNRRNLTYPENGYRMILGTMGVPGLFLLLVGLVGSFVIAVRVATKSFSDTIQRRMGLVGALYVMSIAIAMNITNMFEHELLTFLGVCAVAIGLPDVGKAFQSARTKRKLGHGFANSSEAAGEVTSLSEA